MKYDDRLRQLRFQFLVELIMPQVMVEAFARSLIDKIMLEAFDMMMSNDEKLQMLDNRQESAGIQSQATRTEQQMQDRLCRDSDEVKTTEMIEKMVRGLRNLQIGDATSVPFHLSKLEKQVKQVARSMDVSQADPSTPMETRQTHGQGDMHRIIHDAVIETSTDPMCTRLEKESDSSNEATKVSVSLLYRMIEELESKMAEPSEKKDAESETVSKDKIEIWEETEERFIRTIESVDDTDRNVDSQPENGVEGVAFPFAASSTHLPRNASLEEVAIEEIASSPDEEDCSPNSTRDKKKNLQNGASSNDQKKGILSRTRKLFRNIFGRRKK